MNFDEVVGKIIKGSRSSHYPSYNFFYNLTVSGVYCSATGESVFSLLRRRSSRVHSAAAGHYPDAYVGQPGALAGVSFWPRAGARVIDTIVHYLVAICSGFVFGIARNRCPPPAQSSRPRSHPSARQFCAVIFSLLGMIALETVCEGLHGSTLGKMQLGFVVVQEDGTPCRIGSAFIRSVSYFVDGLFFGMVGYFAKQKTPQQQRHGDEWAHTIVCRRSQVAPENLHGFGQFAMVFLLAVMADSMLMITGVLIKALG